MPRAIPSPLPLVAVVVGTDHHPFDRVVSWADSWAAANADRARVVVQHGTSAPPSRAAGRDLMPVDELDALLREAAAVVCHGGPGTIMGARDAGHVPIVVPRRPELGEHVDAHQIRFTRRVASHGQVHLAADERELAELLDRAVGGDRAFRTDADEDDPASAAVERFGRLVGGLVDGADATPEPPLRIVSIAGWGRSGSTLLDRMIGQVPGVFSVGELRDVWQRGVSEDRLCGCGESFSHCEIWSEVGRRAFGGWDQLDVDSMQRLRLRLDRPWAMPRVFASRLSPSADEDVMRYVDHLTKLYRAIREVSGARVIVDSSKIPTYALLLRQIPEVDLRVVHLVRDPRGVVFSWQKQVLREDGGGRDHMRRYGVAAASGRYVFYNSLTHLVGSLGVPYRFQRYEDLIERPVETISGLLSWARIPVPNGALGFLDDRAAELGTNHTVDGNPMRLRRGSVPLILDDQWRTKMDRRQRGVVSAITSPMLARYGYRLREGG